MWKRKEKPTRTTNQTYLGLGDPRQHFCTIIALPFLTLIYMGSWRAAQGRGKVEITNPARNLPGTRQAKHSVTNPRCSGAAQLPLAVCQNCWLFQSHHRDNSPILGILGILGMPFFTTRPWHRGAQRSCGCATPGSVQSQARALWSSGVCPCPWQRVGWDDPWKSSPTQTLPWFHHSFSIHQLPEIKETLVILDTFTSG